jgi:tRNA uridine 5-carboxymethylaminomethyl modification enzyme
MFTSRAEYRLILREDNADLRLTAKGRELGLVGETRWRAFCEKQDMLERTHAKLKDTWVRVAHNHQLIDVLETPMTHDTRATDLLKRPEIRFAHLQQLDDLQLPDVPPAVAEQVEIQHKYAGYIDRQYEDIARLRKHEATQIPAYFEYTAISGLSSEVMQKLQHIRPATLGQARRISGVTPAALSLLLVQLKKHRLV